MPFLTSKQLTATERVAQSAASNLTLKTALATPLDGITHFKKLTEPTLAHHLRIKNLWRDFTDEFVIFFTTVLITFVPTATEPSFSQGNMKKFVLFMAAGTQGLLDEAAARVTIRGYMRTFFALWRRYAVKIIPPEVRVQVVAYFDSLDLASVVPLTLAKKNRGAFGLHWPKLCINLIASGALKCCPKLLFSGHP
ncbi:hypothetical protein C8J57DRAFT_1519304 [Mycena rebaudengoi]|nr:hypothetical protein C8J57DRAFT_1519304 [Mycena rebaudengoi]